MAFYGILMLKDGLSESLLYVYTYIIYMCIYISWSVLDLHRKTPDFGLSVYIPMCGNRQKNQGLSNKKLPDSLW